MAQSVRQASRHLTRNWYLVHAFVSIYYSKFALFFVSCLNNDELASDVSKIKFPYMKHCLTEFASKRRANEYRMSLSSLTTYLLSMRLTFNDRSYTRARR